jgi:hypothetical protein
MQLIAATFKSRVFAIGNATLERVAYYHNAFSFGQVVAAPQAGRDLTINVSDHVPA